MLKIVKPLLISSALILVSFMLSSQPVSISLLNESTAIPYTRFITTPVHPGIQFGTEADLKQYTQTRLFGALHIGYYYHKSFAQGIYIKPSLGFEYRHSSGFAVSGSLGLGYLHTFTTQEEYKLDNGSYVKHKDSGNARIMPSLGLALNYYLQADNLQSPKIFFGYESWIEYPFSPGFIPLMTHLSTQLGVQFHPFENHKNNE
jgi:hypothetical protein